MINAFIKILIKFLLYKNLQKILNKKKFKFFLEKIYKKQKFIIIIELKLILQMNLTKISFTLLRDSRRMHKTTRLYFMNHIWADGFGDTSVLKIKKSALPVISLNK